MITDEYIPRTVALITDYTIVGGQQSGKAYPKDTQFVFEKSITKGEIDFLAVLDPDHICVHIPAIHLYVVTGVPILL